MDISLRGATTQPTTDNKLQCIKSPLAGDVVMFKARHCVKLAKTGGWVLKRKKQRQTTDFSSEIRNICFNFTS